MKKVAIVFNGGTISMKIDEKIHAAVPSLSAEEIMATIPGVSKFAEVEAYTFSSLPSPHMTLELMLKLSDFIKELVARDDIDGVVVTHGTDTLEETAYFLDLTINTYKPIVVTGAMRSGSELGYDGPFNLETSVCTAISDEAKERGVLVCFNGDLNSASEVTKANSMALNAFRTPNYGPIGVVDSGEVIFTRERKRQGIYNVKEITKDVALIKCVAGMDASYLNFVIDKGIGGIVIEGLGRGNVPPTMIDGIKTAIHREIPVIIVSRCFEGRVHESYGYEGGGKQLKDLGAILGDSIPGQKARIKLLLAINSNKNMDEIKREFE